MGLKGGPPSLFCRAKAGTQWARPSLLQSRLFPPAPGLGSPSRLCPCPGATGTGGGGSIWAPIKRAFSGPRWRCRGDILRLREQERNGGGRGREPRGFEKGESAVKDSDLEAGMKSGGVPRAPSYSRELAGAGKAGSGLESRTAAEGNPGAAEGFSA